jgi:hypothetical protein
MCEVDLNQINLFYGSINTLDRYTVLTASLSEYQLDITEAYRLLDHEQDLHGPVLSILPGIKEVYKKT